MDLEKEKQLRELKELLEHPGWKQFQEIVTEEITGIFERWASDGRDSELVRGEIQGLRISLGLLEYTIGKLNERPD